MDVPFPVSHGRYRRQAKYMVELKHLRLAVLARRCGSFRKAADLLAVRHSALSRSIAELERHIGITLFDRSKTGSQATVAGNRFLDRASAMLEQVDALLESADEIARRSSTRLSLGLCTSISVENLQPIFADYWQTEISIVERPSKDLYGRLRSHAVDIIIVNEILRPAPSAEALTLWHERILVAMSKNHVLAGRKSIYWTDLLDEKIMLGKSEPVSSLEALLGSELAAHHISSRIQRHDACQSLIYSLVAMGLGVSLVPESDVGAVRDDIVCLELNNSKGPIQMSACARWLPENDNPALGHFLSLLAERYPSSPADAKVQNVVAS